MLIKVSREGTSLYRLALRAEDVKSTDLFMETTNPDRANLVSRKREPESLITWKGKDIPRGDWVQRPPTDEEAKMHGVSFQGVMCSLTWKDQFGLASIKPYVSMGMPIRFEFENGNKLLLTQENLADFEAVWLPARLAFFPLED